MAEASNSEASPKIVIVLVHGTFDANAQWTRPESGFCRGLSDLVPGIHYHRFEWSGQNLMTDRSTAATALTQSILRLSEECPSVPLYVIAHSHGGNIAFDAASQLGSPNLLRGIVTLATPFFHINLRDQLNTLEKTLPLAMTLFIGALLAVGMLICLRDAPWWWWFALLPIASSFIGTVTGSYVVGKIDAHRAIAERIGARISEPWDSRLNLLIVRGAGDEASWIISFGNALAWSASRAWAFIADGNILRKYWLLRRDNPLHYPFRPLTRPLLALLGVSVAIVVGGMALHSSVMTNIGAVLFLATMGAGTLLAIVWVVCATHIIDPLFIGPILVFAILANVVNSHIVGLDMGGPTRGFLAGAWRTLSLSILLEVSAESCPHGIWPIIQAARIPYGFSIDRPLSHSLPDDLRIPALVGQWVAAREGCGPPWPPDATTTRSWYEEALKAGGAVPSAGT